MGQQFGAPPPVRTRIALVLFLKGAVTPIILFFENPMAVYEEFKQIIKTSAQSPRLIEKETIGPIKKFSIISTQIAGVAIQEEQFN